MKINPPPGTTLSQVIEACFVLGLEINLVPIGTGIDIELRPRARKRKK